MVVVVLQKLYHYFDAMLLVILYLFWSAQDPIHTFSDSVYFIEAGQNLIL